RRRRCFLSTGATSPPTDREELAPGLDAALGPELGLLAGVDTMGFARAVGDLAASLLTRPPVAAVDAAGRAAESFVRARWATVGWCFGMSAPAPVTPGRRDRRFVDPAWSEDPRFFAVKQAYLIWADYLRSLVDTADLDDATHEKAAWVLDQAIDAAAPTNF